MDHGPKLHPFFRPAPPFGYWYWAVFGMGFYVWLISNSGGLFMLEGETVSDYLERIDFAMILWSPFVLGSLVFLSLPLGRKSVSVEPSGLIFTPISGRGVTDLPFAAIESIRLGYQPRRCFFLDFRIRSDHRQDSRRHYRLYSDQFEGRLVDVLTSIRDVAPEGGFTLEGHRLDISHMGGEEWRLLATNTA